MKNNPPPLEYEGKIPAHPSMLLKHTKVYTQFQQQVCKQNLPMHILVSCELTLLYTEIKKTFSTFNKYLYINFNPQVAGPPVNCQEVCPFSCFTTLLMLPKFSTLITANIIIIPFAVHIYTYHCVQGERSPFALRPALSA